MTSITTLDEIVVRLFGEECLQSFNQVDVVANSSDEDKAQTIDDLANNYLGSKIASAFPKVDLKEERVGIEVTLREFHAKITLQGLSLVLLIVTIASILLGSGVVIGMLQTVFHT